jgi:hypothetical protein
MKRAWVATLSAGIALIGLCMYFYGYENTWRLWNIPVYESPFLDIQLITGTAESLEKGFDPTIYNPYDPGKRIFNYPKVWYLFLNLGLGRRAAVPFAIASLVLFFVTLAVFPKPKDKFTILLLTAVSFSAALMLSYERANVDLVFFASTVIALLLLEVTAPASFLVMILSIVFKIFPLFAIGIYLDKRKNNLPLYALGAVALTGLYFALTWQNMIHVFSTTQKGNDLSYGLNVAFDYLEEVIRIVPPIPSIVPYVLAFVLLLLAIYFSFRQRGQLADINLRNLRAFWAGAGIYVGTFLLGNSWDYRFMFTLLTVPALAEWVRQKGGGAVKIARITVIVLLISCWYLVLQKWFGTTNSAYNVVFAIDEIANWALYFGLTFLYVASLPDWLFDGIQNFFSRINRQHLRNIA